MMSKMNSFMFNIPPESLFAKLIQSIFAIGYVLLVEQLLHLNLIARGSWLLDFSNILLATMIGLFILFVLNFVILQHTFLRLGAVTSLSVFMYFYIYILYGHYAQLFDDLYRTPQYILNMLFFCIFACLCG